MDQLDIEMLEGMANPEALAIANRKLRILLYAPVTRGDDFASAVAYLVRRLDENTAPENYLRSSFEIGESKEIFNAQAERFLKGATDRHDLSTKSLRHRSIKFEVGDIFENAPNADLTKDSFVNKLDKEIRAVLIQSDLQIPIVIDGKQIFDRTLIDGYDPSDNAKIWYSYAVASKSDVDSAVKSC